VNRDAIYEWMDRWLAKGEARPTTEVTDLLPDQALLVTKNGQVEGRELYQVIKETPQAKGSPQELSKFVTDLIAANPPVLKLSHILAAAPAEKRRPAVVLVQNTLDADAQAEALRAAGSVVALMVMSGRGGDSERPYTGNWMNNTRAWLVGRNLPATHAAEINAIVDELAQRSDVDPARITVRATGLAGIPALLAAAVNPKISSIRLTRTPHSVRAAIDAPIHINLHDAVIPGFAVKWDLADLRDLLRPRTVEWRDPTDWMGNVVALGDAYKYSSSDPNVSQ
jgi:hypothetical protein